MNIFAGFVLDDPCMRTTRVPDLNVFLLPCTSRLLHVAHVAFTSVFNAILPLHTASSILPLPPSTHCWSLCKHVWRPFVSLRETARLAAIRSRSKCRTGTYQVGPAPKAQEYRRQRTGRQQDGATLPDLMSQCCSYVHIISSQIKQLDRPAGEPWRVSQCLLSASNLPTEHPRRVVVAHSMLERALHDLTLEDTAHDTYWHVELDCFEPPANVRQFGHFLVEKHFGLHPRISAVVGRQILP